MIGGEKIRWTQQSKDFKEQLGRLVGDVVLATGFLSYCGPYNQEFRANLVKHWMTVLKSRDIPFTVNLNITGKSKFLLKKQKNLKWIKFFFTYIFKLSAMMVESSTVSEWTLQGLPNDELSVQNALIVTKSSSYPLLVDPQTQGKMWIKNKEGANELQITSLNHK